MRPAVRESWYRHGPGSGNDRRGYEPFVEVDWDVALDLVAEELDRIRDQHGNTAIYGGSYGWASAGRFHHAQTQLHRFLSSIGGFTDKRNTYSFAAGEVIVPHVFGLSLEEMFLAQPSFDEIAANTELVVAFGGAALKNGQVQSGGQARHLVSSRLEACVDRGVRFVNLSPLREDLHPGLSAEWIPLRPNTDVAAMLGIIHTLVKEGLHDEPFLTTHCRGWERLRSYLMEDGTPKDADWAGLITGIDPSRLRSLAREMAANRTLVTCSWSVQRADHGEQTYWMAAALAAVIGQVGLPGGGVGYGYGSTGLIGHGLRPHRLPRPQSIPNPVKTFIPVARIADMLSRPGAQYDYDGHGLAYPDIRLVYWAGGNPFHHHQDLNRLAEAWQSPDTIVTHEPFWNALARRSDIVLPATTSLERTDIGGSTVDDFVFWMEQVIKPVGEARNDYDIFSELAHRLGSGDAFTEGRTAGEWLEHLYEGFVGEHPGYPDLVELKAAGHFQIPTEWLIPDSSPLSAFRSDPQGSALQTPSGRIELFSETIDSFAYADCPGHPVWIEPAEWLGNAGPHPLHLITNQPKSRLHSQWDHGDTSLKAKVHGREQIAIDATDAYSRGLNDGDLVRVFNDRGSCLAVAAITHSVMPGVVQLATGAWWDTDGPAGTCRSGNPNVLTRDAGTSSLAQGSSAQTCLVEVERYLGEPPAVRAHEPPELLPE